MGTPIDPDKIRSLEAFDCALNSVVTTAVAQGVPRDKVISRTLRRIAQVLLAECGPAHAAGVLRQMAEMLDKNPTQLNPTRLNGCAARRAAPSGNKPD